MDAFVKRGYLYIDSSELIALGLSDNNLRVGLHRFKRGISRSWEYVELKSAPNKKYVKFNSIPLGTLKKSKLPSEKSLIDKLNSSSDPIESDDFIVMKIKLLISSGWSRYINYYLGTFSEKREAKQNAITHAVFNEFVILKSRGFSYKKLYEFYKIFYEEFTLNFSNPRAFAIKLDKMMNEGVHKNIVHGLTGKNGNRSKITPKHINIVKKLYKDSRKLDYPMIHEYANLEFLSRGLKTISLSSIKQILVDPEVQNECKPLRNGHDWAVNNLYPYIIRKEPDNIGDQWQIDGSRLQFPYIDKDLSVKYLTFFVVLDVHSRKIVGYSSSESENINMIMESLEMAFEETGYVPIEIVSDRSSSFKTQIFKDFKERLELKGGRWRLCYPNQPQDKGHVERFFRTFQDKICKKHLGYVGQGVKSKIEGQTYSRAQVNKLLKRHNIYTKDQLKALLDIMINEYNDNGIGEKDSPNIKYLKCSSNELYKTEPIDIAYLFWNRTKSKVHRSILKLTVKGVQRSYLISSPSDALKMNNASFLVLYHKNKPEVIFVFALKSEKFITALSISKEVEFKRIQDPNRIRKNEFRKKLSSEVIKRNRRNQEYIKTELNEGFYKVGEEEEIKRKTKKNRRKSLFYQRGTLKKIGKSKP